jgi:hypothetical protein
MAHALGKEQFEAVLQRVRDSVTKLENEHPILRT